MEQYFTNDTNLKSERKNIIYKYNNIELNFISDLGVFSKTRIDFGSKLLVETYFKYGSKNKRVLDVGCGYGFIGVSLSKFMDCYVDMIDINKRAVHLSNINIKNIGVNCSAFESNIYENINGSYDVIISNPPIRAGKEVYMNIINNSINYLNDSGEFWFVMNKDHGAKTVIENIKCIYDVNVLIKEKGFFVIRCKKR